MISESGRSQGEDHGVYAKPVTAKWARHLVFLPGGCAEREGAISAEMRDEPETEFGGKGEGGCDRAMCGKETAIVGGGVLSKFVPLHH